MSERELFPCLLYYFVLHFGTLWSRSMIHTCHNRHCNLVEKIIMMMLVIITSTKTKIPITTRKWEYVFSSVQMLFYKSAMYKVQLGEITMAYHQLILSAGHCYTSTGTKSGTVHSVLGSWIRNTFLFLNCPQELFKYTEQVYKSEFSYSVTSAYSVGLKWLLKISCNCNHSYVCLAKRGQRPFQNLEQKTGNVYLGDGVGQH